METDEQVSMSATNRLVEEEPKQIPAKDGAEVMQNEGLGNDNAKQKEMAQVEYQKDLANVGDVVTHGDSIKSVDIEKDPTDYTTAQSESTIPIQSESQSVSTNDITSNIDQQQEGTMLKNLSTVPTTTTKTLSALECTVPADNNGDTSNDTSRSNIPAAVAEIAMREMQQFERINAVNPPPATPPTVLIAPKLSTSGLGLLASQYDSASDADEAESSPSSDNESDSEASVQEVHTTPVIAGTYRTGVIEIDSESDADSSDSDVEFVKQAKELEKVIDVDMAEDEDYTGSKPRGPIRAKGELLLDDLPPIQDLFITVPETECVVLGKVHSIVEQLVLVDSIPGTAPVDLETIIFLDKGAKVLGEVFDVLGQVSEPLYCVRFNSAKQIKERGVEVGQTVYIAPRTEHTHFVILKDMMRLRGSDASWENDIEPTEKHLDYSDDEEERSARRALRNRDRGGEETDASKRQRPAPSPSPQHQPHSTQRYPPRHQYPRPPNRYRSEQPGDGQNRGFYYPNYNARQQSPVQYPPPFAYGPSNASWHANYNQPMAPPPYQQHGPPYPYPYNPHYQQPPPMQRMPFVAPPNTMQQTTYQPPPPQ